MNELQPKLKLWLSKGEVGFLGPGTLRLLKLTDNLKSLKAACQQMELSYSKGWKIVSNVERELGYPILNRQQGGAHGGGCYLTAEGDALVNFYDRVAKRANKLIVQAFNEELKQFQNS